MVEDKMTSADRKRAIQEYYSKRADFYDVQKRRTWKSDQGFGEKIIGWLIEQLAVSPRKLVLEVCVGSGRTSMLLLEKAELNFVGLDLSKEMLKIGCSKISQHKDHVDLFLGDAEHIPFDDETFDVLICTSAMHYFMEPKCFLAELGRVLRPKGLFILGDLTLHELDNKSFLNRLERTISHVHATYFKPSEIEVTLKDAGFEVLEMQIFPYRKNLHYLIEDKGVYFNVKRETFDSFMEKASEEEKMLYYVGSDEMTLFYTLAKAAKYIKIR